MKKALKYLAFISIFTAISSVTTDAQANINSVTGSGSLTTIGDEITGEFDLGTSSVDYTLTLDNISGISKVDWNGVNDADASPSPGFRFSQGHSPGSLTDTWTASLNFSQPVDFNVVQAIVPQSLSNHSPSQFTIDYIGATSNPTIVDPDNQLQNESTGLGTAQFQMATAVRNSDATWSVEGVPTSEVEFTWLVVDNTSTLLGESITIDGSSFEAVSVPFGTSPNLGILILGGMFVGSRYIKHKRRSNIIEE